MSEDIKKMLARAREVKEALSADAAFEAWWQNEITQWDVSGLSKRDAAKKVWKARGEWEAGK